jgi:glutathione S-transferase
MKLIIGNKNLSSWSLRPWLVLTQFGIPFEEILIPLDRPDTRSEILKYSPSGKVPVLVDGDLILWESLAVAEYLAEKFPEKPLWPREISVRARARAVSAEMVASFQTMRSLMPHNLQQTFENFDSSKANADIARVQSLWSECLSQSGGPFLFGNFSIADAMYAPVANRFVTYGVPVSGPMADYVQAIRALPAHQSWIKAALTEKF